MKMNKERLIELLESLADTEPEMWSNKKLKEIYAAIEYLKKTSFMPEKATLLSCSDWEALYLDGKHVADRSMLSVGNVIEALNIPLEHRTISDEWAEKHGWPEKLEDVPVKK